MKNLISLSAALLVAGTVTAAGPAEWASPSDSDLRTDSLPTQAPAIPSRHAETQPVSYAWPLRIDRSAAAPSGPSMESRAYWVDTNGSALERGLKLPLTAPSAIVRVSALHADSGLMLGSDRLQVAVDGATLPSTQAAGGIEILSAGDLQTQGMAVPDDTLAFQLPAQGQPRSFNLQLAGVPADLPLVVHVFEPESPWRGQLAAPSHHFLTGDRLALDVGLVNGESRFAPQSVQAVLVSPDAAHSWPLEVTEDGLGLVGMTPANLPDAGEGLYEVHAYLSGRQGDVRIQRDLKIALQVAAPTARLTDAIETRESAGLNVNLGLEVAAAGRYQISGQVWGTDADGQLQPLAMAQTAAVLEPGQSQLGLEVPAELLLSSGLSAPFAVREVELVDQGRMAVIESRSRGFSIGRDPGGFDKPFDTIGQ